MDSWSRAAFAKKAAEYPNHKTVAPGERIRADDLVYSIGTDVFMRNDDPRWLSWTKGEFAGDCVCVIRSTEIRTVKKAAPPPAAGSPDAEPADLSAAWAAVLPLS